MAIIQRNHFNTAPFIAMLISLVFIAPVKLQSIKFVCMFIILLAQLVEMNKRNGKVCIFNLLLVFVYLALNLFYLIKGTYNNSALMLKLSVSAFLAPLAWAITVIFNEDTKTIKIHKLMRFCLISVLLYTLIYIIFFKLGIIKWTRSPILGTVANYDGGYFAYFSQNMTSLFFLVPYMITKVMNNKNNYVKKKEKYMDIISVLLSLIVVIITGRRALIVLTISTPFIVYFVKNIRDVRKILIMLCFILIIGICFFLLMPYFGDLIGLNQDKFSSFSKLFDLGPERKEQYNALINGLYNNNFLGAGLGVNTEGCIRSDVPGTYELTYFAQLFAFGIIGFIILCSIYISIFIKVCIEINNKNMYSDVLFPIIIGLGIIMIASFSNPYIGNFDYCWLLFFPLVFVNKYGEIKLNRYGVSNQSLQRSNYGKSCNNANCL